MAKANRSRAVAKAAGTGRLQADKKADAIFDGRMKMVFYALERSAKKYPTVASALGEGHEASQKEEQRPYATAKEFLDRSASLADCVLYGMLDNVIAQNGWRLCDKDTQQFLALREQMVFIIANARAEKIGGAVGASLRLVKG